MHNVRLSTDYFGVKLVGGAIRGRERPGERLATSAITVYYIGLVFEMILNTVGVFMAERAFIDNHVEALSTQNDETKFRKAAGSTACSWRGFLSWPNVGTAR